MAKSPATMNSCGVLATKGSKGSAFKNKIGFRMFQIFLNILVD